MTTVKWAFVGGLIADVATLATGYYCYHQLKNSRGLYWFYGISVLCCYLFSVNKFSLIEIQLLILLVTNAL